MKLKSIRVENYKSFRDSADVALSPGFNLIVGQNNSGKTALLEAFRFGEASSKPHRRADIPRGQPLNPHTWVYATIDASGAELRTTILTHGGQTMVPLQAPFTPEKVAAFFSNESIEVSVHCAMNGGSFQPNEYPSHGQFAYVENTEAVGAQISPREDRQDFSANQHHSMADGLPELFQRLQKDRTFVFRAERLNVGTSPSSDSPVLRPDASNLPTALARFAGARPTQYSQYIAAVSTVLPSVKYVASLPEGPNYDLKVWTTDPALDREDLAVSLLDSGTGVGQVLAILFIAMTLPPSVLVIDEPNSFLHPGAAKKLIDILRSYDHQYVISTHSSEIIASVGDAATIHLVTWDGTESHVTQISGSESEDARRMLAELGSTLSDVFSADEVIWVEGVTEEICFPLILIARGVHATGVTILSVKNTGDFEGRRVAQIAWDVYSRLSGSYALVPPALAYSFDRESRTDTEMADLERQSKQVVRFLKRRTYENYLLVPAAISAILAEDGVTYDVESAAKWIADRAASDIADKPHKYSDVNDWKLKVDAPAVLTALFADASKLTPVVFGKTEHSVRITEWIIKTDLTMLEDLPDYVVGLLDRIPG